MYKKILFLSLLIFAVPLVSGAQGDVLIDVNPKIVAANSNSTFTFDISNNGPNSVYIIRLEAPVESGVSVSELITCPEDRNVNDKYTWAYNWDSSQVTCETSANNDNPNILSPGDSDKIVIRAKTPSLDHDMSFIWSVISENNTDFIQSSNNGIVIKIDSSPPAVIRAAANDSNSNGLVDTISLTFDEPIDTTSILASDFTIGDIPVDRISTSDNNTINLFLENNEIDTTEMPNVSYHPSFTDSNVNNLGQGLVGFSSLEDVNVVDELSPKVIYVHISPNPTKIGENDITVIFSESMDNSSIPEIIVNGDGAKYTVYMKRYLGASYKGVFIASQEESINGSNLTIKNAKDVSGNGLANVSGGIYSINTSGINNEVEMVKAVSAKKAEDQILQIKEDADNIASNSVIGWNRDDDSEVIADFYNKHTKRLIEGHDTTGSDTINSISHFIAYGTPSTKILGSGERAGVLGSYTSAFKKLPKSKNEWEDVLKIAVGRWPGENNDQAESRARISFRTIYRRDADMKQPNDNAAITVMAYGLRPSQRNLGSEKTAIKLFRKIFNYYPSKSTNWDAVRAIAYSGATR